MPDMSEDRGLVGEPAKEVWLPDALRREQERMHAEMMASMPKGVKMPAMPEYEPPWVSIGTAPTERQVQANSEGGCA